MAATRQNEKAQTRPDPVKRVAEFFRVHRLSSGQSQQQVVDALGLESLELLQRYESGETPIPLDDIFALTNLLNVPPEDVLGLIFDIYNLE